MPQALKPHEIDQANALAGFFSFKKTWDFNKFIRCPAKILGHFTGNQRGKTGQVANSYVWRVLGIHPVPKKNIVYLECEHRMRAKLDDSFKIDYLKTHKTLDSATWIYDTVPKNGICSECGSKIILHQRGSRVFRFCSETLPGQSANVNKEGTSSEVKNTQYPEFKKWLPRFLIKKDITFRNPAMTLNDRFGGTDIITEFVSYSQSIQSMAGQQRCIAEGQRVLKTNGIWENIENIKSGDELICETLGGHGLRQRKNKVKLVINNGVKDVYRFNCQKGISFEVTDDHLIMIPGLGKSEYKKAGDLNIADSIVCKITNIQGEDTLDTWKLALLGIVLGDGDLTQGCIKFTCNNDKLAQEIEKILPENLKLRKYKHKNHSPDYFITKKIKTGNNDFMELIRQLGLKGKVAANKFVPDIVFTQSRESIAYFLRFLFATDGWASGHCVSYCSTSYRLAQDVFLLLRRLGIRSVIHKREFKNNWKDQWWVVISTSQDVLIFCEQVGIITKEEYIEKVVKEANRRMLSSFTRCSFVKKVKNPIFNKKIKQSVKVKSIEYLGERKVYDIQMEPPLRQAGAKLNNFLIQGGIVVHNCSVWVDEEPASEFLEEQYPRLVAEDGDLVISLTPANRITYMYDDVFEKARVYYRTKTISDKFNLPQIEHTSSASDIAVFQAATDDNPTLSKSDIDALFAEIDDPDALLIRRYGIFKQISGRIFKSFDYKTHVIKGDKYFPQYERNPYGIPYFWTHVRGIDYHEHVNWACVSMAISPQDEAFVYTEFNPSPENMITIDIARELSRLGCDYKYSLNLIDPLAGKTQTNTGMSVIEDLNRSFHAYKKDGLGTGGYWESWDTKSTRGRDEIRKRLMNATLVGRPFSNKVMRNGKEIQLPTLWIVDNCKQTIKSLHSWRLEEWAAGGGSNTKERKEVPQQKWSHFCTALECLFKHPACKPPSAYIHKEQTYDRFHSERMVTV